MSTSSKDDPRQLTVHILGREYQISCPPDEQDKLIASAEYLHDRMSTIRRNSRSMGTERVAIMAALNIARELLDRDDVPTARTQGALPLGGASGNVQSLADPDTRARLQQMELAIERALEA